MTSRPTRRRLLGTAGFAAAGLGGAAAFRSHAAAHGLTARTRAGLAFGTTVALTAAGSDPATVEEALGAGFSAMRTIETAASLFRDDGALVRLNRAGSLDGPPDDLVTLLRFALDLAALTDGAFDPTVQPLWPVWSEATARGSRPASDAVARAVGRIGWRRIHLGEGRIDLEPGTALTLNALIQGHAADRVMAAFRAHGIADAFVDTGEFGACGSHPDGTPWRLGIADPRRPETIADVITPFQGFAATSGDYSMSFSPDRADHHIFDPRTGHSPAHVASVTVTAPTGILADGLSTACMVLGRARGEELVARWPRCAAHIVGKA